MGIMVINPFTGELFPVDRIAVGLILYRSKEKRSPLWTRRSQTIYDMLMAGF